MIDFSLDLLDSFGLLVPAEEKQKLRATNREAFTFYNLQLTPDDCEMILQTAQDAMKENDLVAIGETITPRLIHWFLQGGYFRNYPAEVAELTDIFYHFKGEMQHICDENEQPSCMLSDNAILFYMYRFYICPACTGDTDALRELMSQIIVPALNRLIHKRNKIRKAKQDALAASPNADYAALHADQIAQMGELSEAELSYEAERRDHLFRTAMLNDPTGYRSAACDYDARLDDPSYREDEDFYATYDGEAPVIGMFHEELRDLLTHNPELLLPSEAMEQEWDDMVERWAEDDAAVSAYYQ